MSRKDPRDARKVPSELSKRAAEFPLGELLPEEEKEKLQPKKREEEALPTAETAEELPPAEKKLPGGPSHTVRPRFPGQSGESPDVPGYTKHGPGEHTGMSPQELAEKRRELGESPEEESGEALPKRPTWRDITKQKLKQFDPEAKAQERLESQWGPAEELQRMADEINEFATDLTTADVGAVRNYVQRQSGITDALKQRLDRVLRGVRYDPGNPRADENGEIPVGSGRVMQHALNQLKAFSPTAAEKMTDWLQNDPQGQQFFNRAREQFLIRNAMDLLKNIVLRQQGEGVIQTEAPKPRTSPEQQKEQRRIKELQRQLDEGKITQEEFNTRLKGLQQTQQPQSTKPTPPPSPADPTAVRLNELQRSYNAGEISEEEYRRERARLLQARRLNLKKATDPAGPGGENWWSDYESGPQLNRDKYKKKNRFPFHNEPSADVRTNKGPAKHDLPVPDGKVPAGDDSWGLLASVDKVRKTADNEIFECYSYGELLKGPWFSYTLFKRASQKFKPGDIVVQFGKTPKDAFTYRRRFGTIANAIMNIDAALLPAISTVVHAQQKEAESLQVLPTKTRVPGKPTPDEVLHEIQTGKEPMSGVYGPHTSEYDKQPWQGNRDGFDRAAPRREQDVQRNVFPYEDQEISNQTKIFQHHLLLKKHGRFVTRDELKAYVTKWCQEKSAEVGNYAAPVVETPEERAAKPEQDVPKPLNWDPKRPFPPKRKRYDLNESQLYNQNEHADEPITHYTTRLDLQKKAFDFNVSIFDPQGTFVDETVIPANSIEDAQIKAQEFVNKGHPGFSFQVIDPMNETQRSLGITDISEWTPPTNASKLTLKKQAADPEHINSLAHMFIDALRTQGDITPEGVDRASQEAITAFSTQYPDIDKGIVELIATEADRLMSQNNTPSNLQYAVTRGSLF